MVLASALMSGIHPLTMFKMADVQGVMPLISALARTMARQHFDDESWRRNGYAFLAESTFFVSLFCATIEPRLSGTTISGHFLLRQSYGEVRKIS
jgi:hypothetical protein